jgi:hypothetical protein
LGFEQTQAQTQTQTQSQMQQQEENPQPLVVEGGEPIPVTLGGAEREYIWGPGGVGGGPAGIDEILVQFDINHAPWWMVQDAGGDLVAMCDIGGSGVGGSARVVHTYQFDAYGQCLRASQLVANSTNFTVPYTRLGHKGLFLDRIDVGVASGNSTSGFFDNPRVVGGGYGSGGALSSNGGSIVRYYVRNRITLPEYGIWGQRDPNQSGQPTMDLACHGDVLEAPRIEFNIQRVYSDGGSLRSYCRSSPLNGGDPLGLFFTMGDVMAGSMNAASISGDYNQEILEQGKGLKDWIGMKFVNAAFNQVLDLNWASNWEETDDSYSRHGVEYDAYWGRVEIAAPESGSSYAVASGVKVPRSIQILNRQLKQSATGMGVYIVKDGDGKVLYVGRSKNLTARMNVQQKRFASTGAHKPPVRVEGIEINGMQMQPVESKSFSFITIKSTDLLPRTKFEAFLRRTDRLVTITKQQDPLSMDFNGK